MNEYVAIAAYFGVAFVVFVAALAWSKFRREVKRRLNIDDYRTPPSAHHPTVHS
jgi:hypothetical protein